ncbi:MAG: TolC family protein, partial [Alphaproteobacteria bacterium]|nr:TolC family protein [Alphaproteobacteria bacterium]
MAHSGGSGARRAGRARGPRQFRYRGRARPRAGGTRARGGRVRRRRAVDRGRRRHRQRLRQRDGEGAHSASLDAGTYGRGLRSITQVGGFDAIWELDLFGKYRRLLESTRRDTQAAVEARNAVLVSVIGEVARNYVLLRGLQARLGVARDNIARARQTVALTQSRYAMGISDEYPVTLAKRELASLEAGLPALTAGV